MFTKKIKDRIKVRALHLVQPGISYLLEMDRRVVATALLHQRTFLPFKNICEGKKLVVCGAGPTLNKYIPIENAVHLGVNRSFLYDKVEFDYIFAQDWDGIKMVQPQLINYRPNQCVKFFGSYLLTTPKEIPESFAIACNALRFNMDYYIHKSFKSKFVKDIDRMAIGGMPNVGISVMQLALYMNPAELYIVGCDMSGAHFANGNHTKEQIKAEKKMLEEKWKNDHDKLIAKWLEFKEFAALHYPSTKIFSVNPVGLRGVFEDIDQY